MHGAHCILLLEGKCTTHPRVEHTQLEWDKALSGELQGSPQAVAESKKQEAGKENSESVK